MKFRDLLESNPKTLAKEASQKLDKIMKMDSQDFFEMDEEDQLEALIDGLEDYYPKESLSTIKKVAKILVEEL